jgi:hypothetical protein
MRRPAVTLGEWFASWWVLVNTGAAPRRTLVALHREGYALQQLHDDANARDVATDLLSELEAHIERWC